ncbi:MAG: glycoside hydrolase family 71/99-like protein [Verrucomicrobiota bacterium]
MRTMLWLGLLVMSGGISASAGTKHSPASQFPSYEGRIMCGYQGWFRAEGDGSERGWAHYGAKGEFGPVNCTVDLWPDVSEYAKTYPTSFKLGDGSAAPVFSSWDESTVELHFRWMRNYGIDGVFMQRFYGATRTEKSRAENRVILGHALKASQKYGRALAVMYDLSGLNPGEDCESIIQDWKELVDDLKLTSQGTNQTYLYHRGKPLVAIWGLGFPDRPYKIRNIGIEKLIKFLKNDPQYGGCSIMLGVPTYFRTLRADTVADSYLHEIIAQADVVMPWMVGRFSESLYGEMNRYQAQVEADLAWCSQRKVDYAPCVYPGFSWHNLSKGRDPFNAIPRLKGRFYWRLLTTAIESGAKMIYVAMFDEIDEGTAIFKCSNEPPENQPPAKFLTYEGLPSDHYLWLTGQAGQMLRHEIPLNKELYLNTDRKLQANAKP